MSIDAVMEAGPRSPTLSTRSIRDYDTGFPEPFCGTGNTTLRHPEANTAPNASISADDIDVSRVFNRSRRSFLSKNKRRTLQYGKLTTADLETYNDLTSIVESPTTTNASFSASGSLRQDSRLSKDGSESLGRPSSSAHSDKSTHQDGRVNGRPATSHSEVHHGRNSVLHKLRIHH